MQKSENFDTKFHIVIGVSPNESDMAIASIATPGIYVGTEAVEDDGVPFEEKMKNLKAQLQVQFAKVNVLQQQIIDNFNKL